MSAGIPVDARMPSGVDPVAAAAARLLSALEDSSLAGWDPFDALSTPRVRALARTAVLRRAAIQLTKRSPVNIRPLLGVEKVRHVKALALLASAYSRLGHEAQAAELVSEVAHRAAHDDDGIAWGYDFDVQTRWGYYRAGTPNAVVTSFVAHAMLDVDKCAQRVSEVRHYALRCLLRRTADSAFFSYYDGSETLIHNASLLVAGVFARSAPDEELGTARQAVELALASQRPDGSWPYGEGRGLEWVDGYHTAYNLDALGLWHARTGDSATQEAIARGLNLYLTRLIDSDGAPRADLGRRFPVDIHACSTAIYVLSRLRAYDERALPTATRVLDWTLRHMSRADGRFAFQLHRHYRNSTSYIRWNDAHMLQALAGYLEAVDRGG
jgi:hypothetical protein